eukprot:CAMPEP_0173288102 /NCGR_PEP_ID=MMETSP1143-20121109/10216_1 /TAXON_ID=483371 /ORGANISM="non described non described, Strain CCMP2298" /LENGTH=160 /DNA_ID=CAMNT_0014226801 /DNA_START=377 /DNA_END=859 /DNA_ORIENTATION=+
MPAAVMASTATLHLGAFWNRCARACRSLEGVVPSMRMNSSPLRVRYLLSPSITARWWQKTSTFPDSGRLRNPSRCLTTPGSLASPVRLKSRISRNFFSFLSSARAAASAWVNLSLQMLNNPRQLGLPREVKKPHQQELLFFLELCQGGGVCLGEPLPPDA